MTKIIKEVITSENNTVEPAIVTPVKVAATNTQTYEYLVYYLFGALNVLLIFRLLFKLAGASAGSAFVRFVYGLTQIFILPFEGMFRRVATEGIETVSILEPSTVIAIIVYTIVAVGIVKLIRISSGEQLAE